MDDLEAQPTAIPQEAIDYLQANPTTAVGPFEDVFGAGTAAQYLEPSRSGGHSSPSSFAIIPQEAIDHLLEDRTMTRPFDDVFGEGSAAAVLQANNGIPDLQREVEEPELRFLGKVWDVVGTGIPHGLQEAFNETVDSFESFDVWASQHLDELGVPSRITFTDEEGNLQFPQLRYYRDVIQGRDLLFGGSAGELGDGYEIDLVDAPQTMTGQVVSGISQFAAGYATAGRLTRLAGLRGAFVNGAIADAVVFDPNDPNVMRMLGDWGIETGTLGQILATDPEDPEYINRLRNVAEGALAGAVVEAVGWGVRAAWRGRNGDTAGAEQALARQDEALSLLDEAIAEQAGAVARDAQESLDFAQANLRDDVADAVDDLRQAADEATEAPRVDTDGQLRMDLGDTPEVRPTRADGTPPAEARIYLTPERVEQIRLQARLASGTTTAARTEGLSFRSLTSVNNYDSVLNEIAGVRAVLADEFTRMRGGDVQRWASVRAQSAAKIRNMAEMTGDDPEALIERFRTANGGDMPNLAAEIHAQERYLVTIEEELKAMGRVITDALNGQTVSYSEFPGIRNLDELRLAFNQRREVAANLLAGTSAARSNVARAMNAMKIAKEGDARLREMLRQPDMFRDIDAAARAVADPENAQAPAIRTINESISSLRQVADQINSFRINALLSGPGTQEVNFISNAVNAFVIPAEQMIGGLAGADARMITHGLRQLQGSFASMLDVIPTVFRAGWYDQAILDPFQGKIEEDAFMQSSTAIGRVMTLPSRLLMTMDELFKQSQYRGRVFADGHQLANQQGLTGSAKDDFIQQYLRESFTEEGAATRGDALLQARRSTFTEPLDPGLAAMIQKAAIDHPAIRFFVPFVRTPINILSQTWQHFPLIGMTSQRLRADFAAGGVRAAQARGRQVVGAALTGMAGYLAANGYITGSGPQDPRLRNAWLQNNSPYSFRIQHEDGRVEWISYARIEPLANVFSIAADAVTVMNDEFNERESVPMLQALQIAIMENTVNKTFTQGIYDAMLMFVGRPEEQSRAANNFLASFVPNFLNQTNGDMLLRETRTLADNVMARTGLYNRVDPRRNLLGEPVVRNLPKYDPLGLSHSDIREIDPVMEELTRVGVITQSVTGMPARRLAGPNRIDLAEVPYSDTQSIYDRWMELTGTVEIGGRTLREELEYVMSSRAYIEAYDGDIGVTSRGTKGAILRQVISAYRQAARAELPELLELIEAERLGQGNLIRSGASVNRELFPQADLTSDPAAALVARPRELEGLFQ